MKKFAILSLVCLVSAFMLVGCQGEQGVQAGNEQGNSSGAYQPRPAPKGEARQGREMSGELQRVDMTAKTISIRVDNGMEQTFKFDDNTMVVGLEGQPQANLSPRPGRVSRSSVRNLVGKEGSEVTVQWRDENGAKVATHVEVTQISTSKHTNKKGTGH